jgi:putative copper resistance protein D
MGLEADAVFWRFLQFAALTVLFGAVLFRFQAIDEQHASPSALATLDRWLWRLAMSCAVVALVSALGWLVATATNMIGDLAGALRISGLRTVLTETRFGLVWEWRLAILVVLIVVLMLARFGETPNPARASVAVLAGFALATLSGVGHAVINAGTAGIVHQFADAVHLFAAAAWLGGLAVLLRLFASTDADLAAVGHHALPRFSTMAVIAVALVVLSGIVNAALLLESPTALIATIYGRLLIAKIILVFGMIALGAINRQVLMPRIAESSGTKGARGLVRSVAIEIALGFAVLAIVGAIGTVSPEH